MSALHTPVSYRTPPLIRVGWGALAESLRGILAEVGCARPLLVTDPVVGKLSSVTAALAALGEQPPFAARFDAIPGEPTVREVELGVATLNDGRCDGIVALGGGAVLDTAKAIAMLAPNGGRLPDFMGTNKFARAGVPVIGVPTTAGTGSEVTRFTVITDAETRVKMLITDDKMVCRAAIVDPSLLVEAPPRVTASAGVDALTHAIEAYVSKRANVLADTLALSAIRKLVWSLPVAFDRPTDVDARTASAVAALEAGLAFSNSSVCLVHGMSRPLGAVFGVPHGIANAMLLPTITRFSVEAAAERYADVAVALGAQPSDTPLETATRGLRIVEDLCETLRIPTLGGYGIELQALREIAPKMAQDALISGSPANNPRVPTAEQIVALYLAAH
ncbi:MAG: iron-containing alcohol dehydrogenase [Chloroflexota bacterium]